MPEPLAEDRIIEALRGVFDPELGSDVVDLGMVREVTIDGGLVTVGLALTIAECPMRSQIETDTIRKIKAIPGVEQVSVETRAMTKAQRAELMNVARRRARENASPTRVAPTTRAIAVGSGKGGVGKSSVSVKLALASHRLGYRVGLLDADIWGFSIPRMLGANARIEADPDTRLMQPVAVHGIQVVSTGLIVILPDWTKVFAILFLIVGSYYLASYLGNVAIQDYAYRRGLRQFSIAWQDFLALRAEGATDEEELPARDP